jgi:hypothetical protein
VVNVILACFHGGNIAKLIECSNETRRIDALLAHDTNHALLSYFNTHQVGENKRTYLADHAKLLKATITPFIELVDRQWLSFLGRAYTPLVS